MASTYTDSNRIEKMATGEKSGTWGDVTNVGWELAEDAIDGYVAVTMIDANYTLSTVNGATDEARNKVVRVSGTNTASRDLLIPAVEKVYIVTNVTTGGFSIVVKVSGQTGVTIPNGETRIVYCTATTTYSASSTFSPASDSAYTVFQTITLAAAGVVLNLVNTDPGTSGGELQLYHNSASPAANDQLFTIAFDGRDSAAGAQNYANISAYILDPTSTSEDGLLIFSVVTAGTVANELRLIGSALYPETNDGLALGVSGTAFADLFLASGAVINFNAGDVLITHSANTLTVSGGAFVAQDGGTLGDADADTVVIKGVTVSTFGASLLDDAAASNARTTLELGTSSTVNTGTSGGTIPLLNADATWSAGTTVQFLGGVTVGNDSSDTVIIKGVTVTAAISNTWDAATLAAHADELLDALGTEGAGRMLYHNGTSWVILAPGSAGEVLTMTGGLPAWG